MRMVASSDDGDITATAMAVVKRALTGPDRHQGAHRPARRAGLSAHRSRRGYSINDKGGLMLVDPYLKLLAGVST